MSRPREFDADLALDSAVETFWRNGFEATQVQMLCQAMKLNPGSLYGAFGDKRDLFLLAIDRYIETVSQEAIARINGETSGIAGIVAYFTHLIGAIVDGKRKWGCLITNSLIELSVVEPGIKSKVELHFARLEAAFAVALARAQASGDLRKGIGPEAAEFLVCTVQGLNVLAKTKPPRRRLEQIVRTALSALEQKPISKLGNG